MSEGDGVRISINNLEGWGKREVVISGLNESESEGFLEFLKERGWGEPEPESGWNVQEMPVTEIWLQPASEGIDACVIMKMAAGPKRYARYFPSASPGPHHETPRIEWGWIKGETAVQVWPVP